jgi:two-component system, NarL family, response regulator DevR
MKQRVINVLVASEYPVYRVGMRGMLAGSSLRVVGEASSVGEVLSRVRTKRPDVLLLDLQLRGADSLDFLREAKTSQPRMQVVVVVSRERAAHLPEAINLGCSGFLTKQVTASQLVKTVRAVVHGDGVVEPGLLHELLGEVSRQPAKLPEPHREALSVPEREVLRLITEGRTNRQIAQALGYSFGTVKNYVQKIMLKLAVTDRTQAAVKAARTGLDDALRTPGPPGD